MLILKMIVILTVFLVLLFFAGQNNEIVKIRFGSYETLPAPMYFIIMASLLAGMIIALFMSFFDKLKLRKHLHSLRKEKREMEGELNSLRKMPIVESQNDIIPEETELTKGSE